MKKLIVFSVVFALLTGAAFAQVTLSASAEAGVMLLDGSTKDGTFDYARPALQNGDDEWEPWTAKLGFSYETDGAEAGVAGNITILGGSKDSKELDFHSVAEFGFDGAWWKVVPQLKLNLGAAGFDRGDATDFHYKEGSDNWFGISIYPVDIVAINLSVINKDKLGYRVAKGDIIDAGDPEDTPPIPPTLADKDGPDFGNNILGDAYGNNIMAQIVANIDGIGEVAFTFDNWYNSKGGWGGSFDIQGMGIFLDFNGEFSGIGVKLGFSYLSGNEDYGYKDLSAWGVGLRIGYSIAGADLTLKFDVGQADNKDGPIHDKDGGPIMNAGLEVGYGYDLGMFMLGLSAKLDLNNLTGEKNVGGGDDGSDMIMAWEVGIHLTKAIGGFGFDFGVDLKSDNDKGGKDGKVFYTVPMKFTYAW